MKKQVIACMMFFAVCSAADAATVKVDCPATIEAKQELSSPVAGWKQNVDSTPHLLQSITFYDGPIEENASLVNDSAVRIGGRDVRTWRFGSGRKRLTWISCGYLETSITLAKSLPANVTSCSVTYSRSRLIGGSGAIEDVRCR